MKMISIPEQEYRAMQRELDELRTRLEHLQLAFSWFQAQRPPDGQSAIALTRGSSQGIITAIAEDFDEPLDDFHKYMP
ncbi:hypothetical protein GF339_10840 [candidate division KSB3 bacterium]|uniref:DUF2281 domain-containing protein n=1 Tax=candidate division KSB3 bacterium TaxID=2044937 RepID=A0A9D5JW86_9BACT|nr:hypothetical protein [candidate division KSB3 bacterium]MBD3325072.1 hypothetical protein [candidate division KSB3 bacterium]